MSARPRLTLDDETFTRWLVGRGRTREQARYLVTTSSLKKFFYIQIMSLFRMSNKCV